MLPDSVTDGEPNPEPMPAQVVVYWRPGCPFRGALRRQLRRAGVPTVEVNIWADPDAAGFVRRHARGNETVPTVEIAGTVLVNPAARRVIGHAIDAGVPLTGHQRWWRRADRVD
jgi:mycoredoxin